MSLWYLVNHARGAFSCMCDVIDNAGRQTYVVLSLNYQILFRVFKDVV